MEQNHLIKRIQQLNVPADKSAFLWGPRKTGKSTLIRQQFAQAFFIDLLDYDLYLSLSQKPTLLRQFVEAQQSGTIVIDEIQKIPHLMDEIHWLIESRGYQFIMSGSSARKFRREGTNLLGGRAWRYELYPLVTRELENFDLDEVLLTGLIPAHHLSPDSSRDRRAYVNDYLKEEIQMEALTRNLPAFSRFLHSAALTNGMLLNYSNAAREAGVSVKTIRQYYQILEDTLIGRQLLPWRRSKKRRLIETAKFFFFDTGIVSILLGQLRLIPGTSEYGRAFEHFLLQECWAYSHYSGLEFPLSFWRSASGAEVDLIIGDAEVILEIKSATRAPERTKGLHLFRQEHCCHKCFIVSRDPLPRKLDNGITILPWQHFCKMLWAGEIIS